MEISPESLTKPPVRRRLIQSTLFPHKSQDNAAKEDEDLEQELEQANDEDEHCGSQSQDKKNRKRKPKSASQSRASRKIAVNGKEIGIKNTDEQDSPVIVKADFFVKVSERNHQRRQPLFHSPEEYEQCLRPDVTTPPDVITNSKSPRKPRQRANATPRKKRANATPDKQQRNTPAKNTINCALDEVYCGQMLASPPKPIPDLRLEAKMTAEENSRIFAGKQIHPFFSSWKTGKKNLERSDTGNRWHGTEMKDTNNDFCPVHVFEKAEVETFPLDWRNWTFSESMFMSTSDDPECACSHIFEGSVDCLKFDNFLDVSPLRMSSCQKEGSSSQCPIQLEELSLNKYPAISSTFVVDKQEVPCNNLRHVEVVCLDQEQEIANACGFSENAKFSLTSDIEKQNTFFPGWMTANYHDCSHHPENSLWTNKYQPERANEICGNSDSVKFLNEWLRLWHEKGSRTNKYLSDNDERIVQEFDPNYSDSPSDCDSEDVAEESSLKNVLLVTGPVGSGKSAAIYACAKEQGFQVIEVNTSDWRSGALVKQKFGEAVESHWLQCSMQNPESSDDRKPSKSSTTTCNVKAGQRSDNEVVELVHLSDGEDCNNVSDVVVKSFGKEDTIACARSEIKTLILFEDVDAALCEDRGFVATIQQLAETAKRPMILTSNSEGPDLPNNLDRLEVSFTIPSSEELFRLVHTVCAAEKANVKPGLLEMFIDHCHGDIRKTITLLQFWCQGQNQRKGIELRNTYAPLVFDIHAAHHVLPQTIPCGYTSKLAEMIEKEITKSRLMVEKDVSLMDILEEKEERDSDSRMDINEPDSIETKKDEMLRRHCSYQDRSEFAAQCVTTNELPCSSSFLVPCTRRTLRRKYEAILSSNSGEECFNGVPDEIVDVNAEVLIDAKTSCRKYDAVVSSDSEEECLNVGLPHKIIDVNANILVEAKTSRRKYNAVMSSDSEEDCVNEGLSSKIVDVNAEVLIEANNKSLSLCLADEQCFSAVNEQLLSEGENLNNNFHPSLKRPDYSDINGTCKSGDVSCVPESSFVPETVIENESVLFSSMNYCEHVDGRVKEASVSTDFRPKTVLSKYNNVDGCLFEKDEGPVIKVRDFDLNTVPVHGEEVGDSHVEPMEALPREYQMMDECSRIDFSRKAESMRRLLPLASTEFVHETWKRLRNCHMELKQYVSLEERDSLEGLGLAYGMTNLISEADLLLSDCQSLISDYLKPSMVPTEKSQSFCWHDDQLQMASTIAQHGFCFYAKRSAAAGLSPKRVDLASEMLKASSNSISLGKLVNQSNRTVQSSGKNTLQSGAPSKSMVESSICNTVESIVPLRSRLSVRDYVFHEYLSTLVRISKSESFRLSEGINMPKRRRRRDAQNYLSNGALALSPEDISLLDQYRWHHKGSSLSKDES